MPVSKVFASVEEVVAAEAACEASIANVKQLAPIVRTMASDDSKPEVRAKALHAARRLLLALSLQGRLSLGRAAASGPAAAAVADKIAIWLRARRSAVEAVLLEGLHSPDAAWRAACCNTLIAFIAARAPERLTAVAASRGGSISASIDQVLLRRALAAVCFGGPLQPQLQDGGVMADRPAACPDDVLTALLGDVLVTYPDARQCTLAAVVRIAAAARSQAAMRSMDDEGWAEALVNAGSAVVAERLARVLMGMELPASEGEAAAERTLVRQARSGRLPGLPSASSGESDDDDDDSDDDSDSDSDSDVQGAASGSAGRSTSAPPLSEQRRAFEDAWMATLRLDMPRRALLAVLTALPSEKVLANFDRPLRLADFFTKAYDGGAGTGANEAAMLALRGIFLLTTRHGLDYPGFYTRLYALVTPAALSSPFRPRFLRLLALFLGSPALAAKLAAAFAKRLARAALASPTPAAFFAVPAIYNILKAHPSLATMIHRGELIRAGPKAAAVAVMEAARGVGMDSSAQALSAAAADTAAKEAAATAAAAAAADPFDPAAADPAASFASASQLWEVTALRRHWHSSVAQRCGMFERSLDRPPMDLDASAALTFAELAATESRRRAAAARAAAAAAAAAAAKEAPARARPGKRPRGHHPLSDPSGTTLADVKPVAAALLRVPGAAVTLDSVPAKSALDTLGRAAPSEVGGRALQAAAVSTPPKGGEATKNAVALVQLGAVAAVRGAGLDLLGLLEVAATGGSVATVKLAPAAGAGAGQTAQDFSLAEGPTVDMDKARAWVPRSMDDEDEEEAAAAAGNGADGGRAGKRPRRDPAAGPVAGWSQTFGFDAGAAGAAMARTSAVGESGDALGEDDYLLEPVKDVGGRGDRRGGYGDDGDDGDDYGGDRRSGGGSWGGPMAAESENTSAYLGAIAHSFGAKAIHEAVERTASRESGLLSLLAYKAMSFQACAYSGCSMMVSAQDDIYCPSHQKSFVLDAWHAAAPERETDRPAEDAPRLANNDFPGDGTEPSFASFGDSPAFMRRALSDMAHPHGASHAAERARALEQSKPVATSGPSRVAIAMATQREPGRTLRELGRAVLSVLPPTAMASSSAVSDREREFAEHEAAYRQERLELLQDITTLAQDAAMNFGSLNDNLDRLIGLTQSVAATRPTWQALARSTFGQHVVDEAESKQS